MKKKRASYISIACMLFFFIITVYNLAPNLALGNGAAK